MKKTDYLNFSFNFLYFELQKRKMKTDSKMQIREIAWNSLSEQEKSAVIIDWRKATVTETTYNQNNVYAVVFNTSNDALIGPNYSLY